MSNSAFPVNLDTFVDPNAADITEVLSHALQHDKANDAIANLEAKVGVNGSSAVTSHDSLLRQKLDFRGNWQTLTDYAVNDVVLANNLVYVCIVAHTSGTTLNGNSANWFQIGVQAGAYDPAGRAAAFSLVLGG